MKNNYANYLFLCLILCCRSGGN